MDETNAKNTERDKERLGAQLDLLAQVIGQENSAFLSVGGLSVALLVVISFNKEIVAFSINESKILLTILLILIVITLSVHAYFMWQAKKKSLNIIEQITGKDILKELHISRFSRCTAYVPLLVMLVFSFCIFYAVCVIWRT